jgi:antitoxin component of MazEF toxin-antitoxin module
MTITTTKDGYVPVPTELARLAGIEPGVEIDIELTDQGLLVRPKAVADAEDAEDVAAAEAALREIDQGAEPVPWEQVKRRHGL